MGQIIIVRGKRWILTAAFCLFSLSLVVFLPGYFASQAAQTNGAKGKNAGLYAQTSSYDPDLRNYDIRTDPNKESTMAFREAARTQNRKTASSVGDIRAGFAAGERALIAKLPNTVVEYNDTLRLPEVISPNVNRLKVNSLAPASSKRRSDTLRDFVEQNQLLFGITPKQLASLEITADYTNPSGDLSFADLEQNINGIPVFQGEIKAAFPGNGGMARIINDLAPGLDYAAVPVDFGDPNDAVAAAYGDLNEAGNVLELNSQKSTELKAVYGSDDFATTAEKMYFPLEPGVAVPSWRVLVWRPVNAFYVIVDAQTGTMLWRKNITNDQTQTATYEVYEQPNGFLDLAHNPAPFSPGPLDPTTNVQGVNISRTSVATIFGAGGAFDNSGWITDGNNTTDGNAVEAGLDIDGVDGVDAATKPVGSPSRTFSSTWNPPPGSPAPGDAPVTAQARRGAVIQMFYAENLYHDALYQLGFNEAAHNFQNDNFGRGGSAADRISAQGQDSSGTNNANFSTPADGSRGRMQMYVWTGPTPDYDGTADAEVIFHETTHGTSNRLIGNSSGLISNMSGGMGEGWSDFYAEALLSNSSDPVDAVYTTGGYVTYQLGGMLSNTYYGIRRFPRAPLTLLGPNGKPHDPFTFKYVNSNCDSLIGTTVTSPNSAFPRNPTVATNSASQPCDQVHNLGEIWSSMLWEVRNRMVTRLGHTAGTTRVLQLVTNGMKLTPLAPTMLQARDAILAAALAESGTPAEKAADVSDIREGFRVRGMGASASIQNIGTGNNNTAVTEAYDVPNVIFTTPITISDPTPGGDNDGSPEPGESVLLSVPITNNTGAAVTNVFASVTGGGTTGYGTINDGQTITQTISYTIPAGWACGSQHTINITGSSTLGPMNPTSVDVTVGQPIGGPPATFTGGAISIPGTGTVGVGSPYPGTITVAGLTGNKKIQLELTNLNATYPGDMDLLLVGPGGQKFKVVSDVDSSSSIQTNAVLVLTDNAASSLPANGNVSLAGVWKPTDYNSGTDTFAGPAPAGPYLSPAPTGSDTLASAFGTDGSTMNGTWSLYGVDDSASDSATIAGWKLTFVSTDYVCDFGTTTTSAVSITKTDNTSGVVPGGSSTYLITASNAGPDAVTGATVTDNLPPGITSAVWTCSGSGAGAACAASGSNSISDTTVNIPANGSVTYTLVAQISNSASGTVANTAAISVPAGVLDSNPADNSATDTDTVNVPTITILGTLNNFGSINVGDVSSAQSYTVSGTSLSADLVITAPNNFEISLSSSTGFGTSLTLDHGAGTILPTLIYVRFAPGSTGIKTGNVTNVSIPATTQNVAVAGTGVVNGNCISPIAGMLAWYPGEGTANDAFGANNGSLANGATFGGGEVSEAFSFDGANDYVDLGFGPELTGTSGFSLDTWVNTKNTDERYLMTQRDSSFNGTEGSYAVTINAGKIRFYTFNSAEGGYGIDVTSNATVNDGFYHHVTVVRESNGVGRIYVDGSLDNSSPATTPNTLIAHNIYMGGDVGFNLRYLQGNLDEVHIFARSLSASEVSSLYNSATHGVCYAPEIAVSETSSGNINDGGSFSFGSTLYGVPVTKTFTVFNAGTANLSLGSFAVPPAGYVVQQNFGTLNLAPNASTTFKIQMTAAAAGTPSGSLTFGDNDADENPFDFTISGTVNKLATATAVVSNLNPSIFGQSVKFTASVTIIPPAFGTLSGTVTFNVDGTNYCSGTAIDGAGVATCTLAGLPALGGGTHMVTASYSGDGNFNGSTGTLTGGQVVKRAETTTSITNVIALQTSSLVNQSYAVIWTTTVNAPGSGTPTGNVVVSDGSQTCTAAVAAGTCNLTSTTVGVKDVTVTYTGDANFNTSSSTPVQRVPHTVNLQISGSVSVFVQGGPNTALGGASVTLRQGNTTVASTTTNGSGAYSFTGQFTGTYVVAPTSSGHPFFDPLRRTLTNLLDNTSNVNFVALDLSGIHFPRELGVVNQFAVPGQNVTVPVVMKSLGNERTVTVSLSFDNTQVGQATAVQCGADAGVGCTVTSDTAHLGNVGVTVSPQGGGTFAAGAQIEIAKITFPVNAGASAPNTSLAFGNIPFVVGITDISGNPMTALYNNGLVVLQQGLEGDVAGRNTGDGQVLANDVAIERGFVVGSLTPDATTNEFQRADAAGLGTKGDGKINAADVVQVRRFELGLDQPGAAGGVFTGTIGPIAPPETNQPNESGTRAMGVTSTDALAGDKASVYVTLDAQGNEAATSFTIDFDAMKLANPQVTLGTGAPADAVLTLNTEDASNGHITVLVDSMNLFEKAAGKQVIGITFDVRQTAAAGPSVIGISNGDISDKQAQDLAATYTSGIVTINGSNQTGVEISGRITTPEGIGLRAASVILTDPSGNSRTTTSSSLGFYVFDGVAIGREYTITVNSKRYRFASRKVTPTDNLIGVDLTGVE